MFVEFLDESQFWRDPPLPLVEEPILVVPLWWVEKIAQPDQLRRAEQDGERRSKLAREGVLINKPLKVTYDQSRIVLEDGHNRVVHARTFKLKTVPVWFARSEKIKVRSTNAVDALIELIVRR